MIKNPSSKFCSKICGTLTPIFDNFEVTSKNGKIEVFSKDESISKKVSLSLVSL